MTNRNRKLLALTIAGACVGALGACNQNADREEDPDYNRADWAERDQGRNDGLDHNREYRDNVQDGEWQRRPSGDPAYRQIDTPGKAATPGDF